MRHHPSEFKPFVEQPPPPAHAETRSPGDATVSEDAHKPPDDRDKAHALARQVFAAHAHAIDGIDYAIEYHLADDTAGGDIVDVYGYDNGSVSFLAADVEGRGVEAASRAAMIKYSLRGYASAGLTVETCVSHLDRAFIENCAFEKTPSFASAFFAITDMERRTIAYCSAGHDIAIMARPDEPAIALPVTSPILGVFDEQRHLFPMRYLELLPGSLLLLGTDGITEARDREGRFFGIERLVALVDDAREEPVRAIAGRILRQTMQFCDGNTHDDIAIAAIRFH